MQMFGLHNYTAVLSTIVLFLLVLLMFCPAYCSNITGTLLCKQLVQIGHGTVEGVWVQTRDQSDQGNQDRSCCFQAVFDYMETLVIT